MADAQQADGSGGRPPGRHMALVANEKAGALLARADGAGTLEEQLRAQAGRLSVIAPDAGSLPERMAQAIATGADTVVVAGGDGSLACAASALLGGTAALGLIPCGTMNLLARDLGLDPADAAAAIATLGQGAPRAIDVGTVSGADGESHVFLCASMLGTPARLTRFREAGRAHGGGLWAWLGFGRAAARALVANRSMRLVLRCNGQVMQRRTPSLTITVNRLDEDGGGLFGRARLDGGVLVLYVVHRAPAWRQAWLLLRAAATRTLAVPEVEVIETTALEIDAGGAALHVLVDGEQRFWRHGCATAYSRARCG